MLAGLSLQMMSALGEGKSLEITLEVIMLPHVIACLFLFLLRFPGCRTAYEEMLQVGYITENVCEEGQDSSGGAKRWCVATVVKPWYDAL